jgi:hypothetical protein
VRPKAALTARASGHAPLPDCRRIGRRFLKRGPANASRPKQRVTVLAHHQAGSATCRRPRSGLPPPPRSAFAVSHDLDGLSLSEPSDVFQSVALMGFVCRRGNQPGGSAFSDHRPRDGGCPPELLYTPLEPPPSERGCARPASTNRRTRWNSSGGGWDPPGQSSPLPGDVSPPTLARGNRS